MKLEYSGVLKSYYPEYEFPNKRFIIDIYDTDNKDDGYKTRVGQISGYCYITWQYHGLPEILEVADGYNSDEIQILDAITPEEEFKKRYYELSNLITIDRLYIFKKYRNKGYAIETMKNIMDILYELFIIDPYETIIGLITSPFELLDKDEAKLDLSILNLDFLDSKKAKLQKFYSKAGFKRTKSDPDVYYRL